MDQPKKKSNIKKKMWEIQQLTPLPKQLRNVL